MFDPNAYGADVARLLALDGAGQRLMPLAGGQCSSDQARDELRKSTAAGLFPNASAPEAALAGLYLYFSCWEEAHAHAQDIETAEGSYWHAIVHRQEPDAFNAGYWFRRVGAHPIFPALRDRAAAQGLEVADRWDPFAFVDICARVRSAPGSKLEESARAVQLFEWQLLFDYCARPGA
jgi:hypothetical protein